MSSLKREPRRLIVRKSERAVYFLSDLRTQSRQVQARKNLRRLLGLVFCPLVTLDIRGAR